MRSGILGLCACVVALGGCEVLEKPLRNSEGLVSKSAFRQAVSSADLVREVPMRGQALMVSQARVGARDYAVLKFVPKFTTRRDQPDMAREVLPTVERVTGCAIAKREAFGPGYFMPRETDVVVQLSCGDASQEVVVVEPVVDLSEGDIIELPEPEFDAEIPL